VEWRDAKIHVLTHTLHYGCGAFEGVRAYNTVNGTAIFRLREHTERLFNSAKILRMKIPFSLEQVMQAQREVVRANKLESCYLRPLTWIGSEKLGVSPKGNTIHLMVAAWSWGAYLGEEGLKRGIRVKTSSYTRHHVNITMTQAKAVSNYTNSILANMEATDEGYDEALLLDSAGFVSEGAGENLFIIKKGVVYTPDLSAGALNGITRDTILRSARTWASSWWKSASPATRSTSATRPSSPAPLPRSRRSASSTASRSARARAGRSPRRSRAPSSTSSTGATRSTPNG
jgi:branched-chain amino acid aminotransferase